MSTPPWTKEFKDIKRYDWLTAVSISPKHSDKPRDLRLANCLMQHMHGETGLSFPTQETMAKWARLAGDRQVRESIYSLEASKAVTRKRMGDLQPETQAIVRNVGHRSMRAVVYKINLYWAFETFEAYKFEMANGDTEARKSVAERMRKRSTTDRYQRTEIDRLKPDWNRPANTVGHTVDTLISAGNEGFHYGEGVRIREDIDPLVFVPPDDPEQARMWLFNLCADKSRLAEGLGLLALGKLTPEIARELAA